MLNSQEIENLKRLLADEDLSNLELGLFNLANNLEQIEEFMPILCAQFLLNSSYKTTIDNFFREHARYDLLKKYKSRFKFLEWAKKGFSYLCDAIQIKPKATVEAAFGYFLEYWDRIKIVFISSPELLTILADVGYYCFYEKNQYLLATEIAWLHYQHAPTTTSVETFMQWLAHYHFPHNNLIELFPQMDKEALAYQQDPNLDETEQFRFIWLRGLMHQGVGKIEESAKIWQDGLNLIADSVDIQYFAGDLIDNIHFHLSMQAIRAGNMDLAHKYLKQFKQNDDPTEYSEAKALILTAKGKSKKAIHNLWESIKERPTDESYYKTLVEIYQKSEQTELIIDTWINCLTHSPEYGMGMRELVKLLPNSTRPDAQELLVVYKNKLASWEKAVLGLKAKLI